MKLVIATLSCTVSGSGMLELSLSKGFGSWLRDNVYRFDTHDCSDRRMRHNNDSTPLFTCFIMGWLDFSGNARNFIGSWVLL